MKYSFIEIGTSDIETLAQTRQGELGMSVEPVKAYLDNLPDSTLLTKVNCAISNHDGLVDVFWMKPEDIEKHQLPFWMRGCNAIHHPHPTMFRVLREHHLESLLQMSRVEVLTWKSLVRRYNIQEVQYLKIDAEGHDCVIVNNILDDAGGVLPRQLSFECNGLLTDGVLIRQTTERVVSFGYKAIPSPKPIDDGDRYFEYVGALP